MSFQAFQRRGKAAGVVDRQRPCGALSRAQCAAFVCALGVCHTLIAESPPLSSAGEPGCDLPSNPYAHDPQLSCGPRCAAFLFDYFAREVAYSRILEECAPGPLGTNLEQVKDLLEKHHLSTRGFSGATTRKMKRTRVPAIVHLTGQGGSGHFLVLLGWDSAKRSFHVYSPPSFYGHLSEGEIAGRLSGVGLAVSDRPLPEAADLLVPDSLLASWLALLLSGGLVVWAVKPQWLALVRFGARRGNGKRCRPWSKAGASIVGFCFLSLSAVVGCDREASSGGAAAGSDREISLGRVIAGPRLKKTFRLRNGGASAFHVTNVRKACSCEAVKFDKSAVVDPGACADVTVDAPTKGREGPQAYHFVVETDSSEEEWKAIPIVLTAQVAAKIKANPSQLVFGVVKAGIAASSRLVVVSSEGNVRDRFRGIELRQRIQTVSLTERSSAPAGTIEFDVAVSREAPIGDIAGTIVLSFEDDEVPKIEVPVIGRVEGDIYPVPSALTISLSENNRGVIGVMSRSKAPFKISAVQTREVLSVAPDGPDGDSNHRYTVSTRDAIRPGEYSVVFITDQPLQSSVSLPVFVRE